MENSINVIYSANVDSMDSWDIENLKYLRKLSKGNPVSEKALETMSYQSESECFIKDCEDLLDSAIYSANGSLFLKKSIRSGRRESQTLKEMVLKDINNNVIAGPQLDNVSLPIPLEDCYVMDVLMVRNESVLTDKSVPLPCPSKSPDIELIHESEKIELSRELNSSPSSISSDDSFTSAIAKGFFDMDERSSSSSKGFRRKPKAPVGIIRLPVTNRPINSPIKQQAMPIECPFCGGCGRTDSFSSRKGRKEDAKEILEASIAPTVGDEPPPIDMPETPSPYYIRLRKDLVPSNSPPLSVNKPKNFGLDKQGQLVIDYSSNWESLESYVKSLGLKS